MTDRFTREQTLTLMEDLACLGVAHDITLRTYFINDGTPAYTVVVSDYLMKLPTMQGILDIAKRHGLDAWFDTQAAFDGDWDDDNERKGHATIADPAQGPANRFMGTTDE